MAKISSVFNKISLLRERYYKASTGKGAFIKLVGEAEVADQVYNSNAIENSTLSLEETEKILLAIDLDRFISEREIFEAKNLARVVSYIDKRSKEQELTLDVMLSLHKMLIGNIRDYIAANHEHIIKRITRLHLTFEFVHPFIDGNGRIGRVINNYLLIREGFVP